MIQSEQEQNSSKLVLPSLDKNKRFQSVREILTIITQKKSKYQREIQKQQPSNRQYSLQYARYDTQPNSVDYDQRYKQLAEEEQLARGSIIDHSIYEKGQDYKNKRTLQTNSTIQYGNTTEGHQKITHLPVSINKLSIRSIEPRQKYSCKKKQENVFSRRQKSCFQDREKDTLEKDTQAKQKERVKTMAKVRQKSEVNIENFNNSIVNKQKEYIQTFKDCISDLKRGSKTNERLEKAVKSLQCFNPFFRKIQRVIGVCLLRIGRIRQKQVNSILYQAGESYTHFAIILLGEVKIFGNNGMHKICETGQTLLEEVLLFQQTKPAKVVPNALQKAKVMEESWILQVQKVEMLKLQKELYRFGFRQGLRQMKTLIKRNSIVKNWLRNKFTLMKKHLVKKKQGFSQI